MRNKIYVVKSPEKLEMAFTDKMEAHRWAEDKFGSRQDGICIEGVSVESCILAGGFNDK